MDYSIPFKSLSLTRAAKYFNCEEDDFFHWHEIGLIRLCIECDDYRGRSLKFNGNYTEFREGHTLPDSDESPFSYRGVESSLVVTSYQLDDNGIIRPYGVIDGFFIPSHETIRYLSKSNLELATDFLASPYDKDIDSIVIINVTKNNKSFIFDDAKAITFKPEIRRESLLILNHDLLVIRDLLNPQTKSNGSQKTVNAMAKFIKQLIAANYGNEVARSPRKHIDGKTGAIQIHFDTLKMKPPSGNTVESWLDGIDLD